ncbi:MAG: hypothetical protein IKT58_00485 [Oscillospiraceae bacterium]|nr:hypothetical protein [Oscillospiraceae bacterium]
MAGRKLRKFAQKHSLHLEYDRAYGSLCEYTVTVEDGGDYLSLFLTTYFSCSEKAEELGAFLQMQALHKTFDVYGIDIREDRIRVQFLRHGDRFSNLLHFLKWFSPVLEEYGACKETVCPCCGEVAEDGRWKLVRGVAYRIHEDCAPPLKTAAESKKETTAEESSGNELLAIAGGFVAVLIGTVIWALFQGWGYTASLVGFLMVLLAGRAYSLLKGQGGRKGRILLSAMVVLGILVGALFGNAYQVVRNLHSYGTEISLWKSLRQVLFALKNDGSSRLLYAQQCMLGVFFAAMASVVLILQNKAPEEIPDYTDLPTPAEEA